MRVVPYGPGGVGKTKLGTLLKQMGIEPLSIDLEGGSYEFDIERVDDITSYQDLRDCLHDESLCGRFGAIIIDSLTKVEELCVAHAVATIPHEKGHMVDHLEDFGWGKGYTHVYELFLVILADLDQHIRKGRHVVATCHECVANVPNPSGEDFIRFEPRLQAPASGKSSVRHRVKEWADHLLFIGYDTFVTKDGKAQGSGTRTIYPTEMPTHWAKSRKLSQPIPYADGDASLWQQLLQS